MDVTIESDTEILPGTFLHGATSIASGAIIGPDTTLVDCQVGEGAQIHRSEATLVVSGQRAAVGPYSFTFARAPSSARPARSACPSRRRTRRSVVAARFRT